MSDRTARPDLDPGLRASGFDPLRTERWIGLIRLAVIAIVIAIYLGAGVNEQRQPGVMAIVVLTLAIAYGAWSLVAFAGPAEPSFRARALSVLLDVGLVTVWLQVTGGTSSEYWSLYLVVLISVAMRSDLVQTMAISVGMAVLYGALAVTEGILTSDLILHRTSLMIITGFAAGVLAQQRLVHRRRGAALQTVADERSRELVEERVEVERLRRVDGAKSEFVAVAAHEFRTPLAAVIGVLSTLREHSAVLTPEERRELLDGAATQASRLARLVDDLLTVSRIEDGVLRLALEPVDPRHLLSEAAQASDMTGRLVIQVGRVGRVRCDPDAIIRVLTNLLDNAKKYSPPDSKVHIAVALEDDLVRFRVSDEGAGIPEDERLEVFERFRRLDGGGKKKPGAGLGLYICRGLVGAHGGTIGVGASSYGGAEFSFTLPRATKADDEAAQAAPGVGSLPVRLPVAPAEDVPAADVPAAELPSAAVR